MRKQGVSEGSVGYSVLAVTPERTPGAETARSRSRASSCCRDCWSLPGMIGRGASCADTASGISHAADSNTTGVRIVIDVVLLVRSYGLGARCPGIQTHSVPLHFQKPMTQIVLDQEGNTGSISCFGGGCGGAPGGAVSQAHKDPNTASAITINRSLAFIKLCPCGTNSLNASFRQEFMVDLATYLVGLVALPHCRPPRIRYQDPSNLGLAILRFQKIDWLLFSSCWHFIIKPRKRPVFHAAPNHGCDIWIGDATRKFSRYVIIDHSPFMNLTASAHPFGNSSMSVLSE